MKLELRAACTVDLRRNLFDFIGEKGLSSCDEVNLLQHIKQIAVEGKNPAVHRQEFYAITQSPDQPVTAFVGSLQAKAAHCCFNTKCECGKDASYTEDMVADQMIVGLYDKDVQAEVLSKYASLVSLKDKINYIGAIEEGKRATSSLGSSSVAANKSQYKSQQCYKPPSRHKIGHGTPKQSPKQGCSGCGSHDHGSGTDRPRAKYCPHWQSICSKCGRRGHVDTAPCRTVTPSSTSPEESNVGSFTSSLFTLGFSAIQPLESEDKMIPHMEWCDQMKRFVPQKPRNPKALMLSVNVIPEAHSAVECTLPLKCVKSLKTASVQFLADTGAQTCACDINVMRSIGLKAQDLLPTSHNLLGATKNRLNILGAALVEISKSTHESTRVMMYICSNISGAYLSESAQIDIGIIPQQFPHHTTITSQCAAVSPEAIDKPLKRETRMSAPCGCPIRTGTPPPPSSIPAHLKGANAAAIEKWILSYYASSAFNVCEHQSLPIMTGKPLTIHYRPEAQPKAHHVPIPVPHHSQIDADVRIGTIERVPQGTPTIWCSRMVVVPKKDGRPRRTVDLQALNAASYRETHHAAPPFTQVSAVPSHTVKTTLDAWNGYHSLPLAPSACDATTFITEWGRYRYLRAPQGFHAAGDAYTRAYDDIVINIKRKSKVVDDTILWDKIISEAFIHAIEYIDLCSRNGIIFSPKKFAFARDEVEFAGFVVSHSSIQPSKKITNAISNFPVPKNITDARSWFGLVNQVAFSTAVAPFMQPFSDLLKDGKWYWDDNLTKLFEASRTAISQKIQDGVRTFEIDRPTCLSTDWSQQGIGFTLQQKICICDIKAAPLCCPDGWKLVLAGSRFTSAAESRYAPVEGEALAVTYGLEKCRLYIAGCHDLIVAVDHAPLVKLLSDRHLNDIPNPRLLRLKEKTLNFTYNITHVPGVKNKGPDALSRYPVAQPDEVSEIEARVIASISALTYHKDDSSPFISVTWERIEEASRSDGTIQKLAKYIINGFPASKQELPPTLHPFWDVRDHLTCIGDAVAYGSRIAVPVSLRSEVLDGLHGAHQGPKGMSARARLSVYWPGIDKAIAHRRQQCNNCNSIAPSQPSITATLPVVPDYPFQFVVADYFDLLGRKFLVYADRYTGWVAVSEPLYNKSDSCSLMKSLREWFSIYGVPQEIATDGGQPFPSQAVQRFLKSWGCIIAYLLPTTHKAMAELSLQ